MKQSLLFIFSIILSIGATAQPANRTVYNCNGVSKNIYSTIAATGKSIIVAHKGVDCGICISSAPGWQTWAAANKTNVEVWGAITYTYNPNQFTTAQMCTKTLAWKSTHGWTDIFTFPDSSRLWALGGSPRYYVYSAVDSSIVYQGSSPTAARNMALSQSTVGLAKSKLKNVKVYYNAETLRIESTENQLETVSIFNMKGQLVHQEFVSKQASIDVSFLSGGAYFVQLKGNSSQVESRKLLFH